MLAFFTKSQCPNQTNLAYLPCFVAGITKKLLT